MRMTVIGWPVEVPCPVRYSLTFSQPLYVDTTLHPPAVMVGSSVWGSPGSSLPASCSFADDHIARPSRQNPHDGLTRSQPVSSAPGGPGPARRPVHHNDGSGQHDVQYNDRSGQHIVHNRDKAAEHCADTYTVDLGSQGKRGSEQTSYVLWLSYPGQVRVCTCA